MELETLVEGLGHRVLGVARTHAEALALTKSKRPGLILADIQLADGSSGLEAVNELFEELHLLRSRGIAGDRKGDKGRGDPVRIESGLSWLPRLSRELRIESRLPRHQPRLPLLTR